MKNLVRNSALLMLVAALGLVFSCKKDDDKAKVIAGFTFEVDANDYRTVKFTNTSQDYVELSWNFGDGSALSTEESPSHQFAGAGTYTVSLTATDKNGKDQDIATQTVTLVDPDQQLTALAGNGSKTWKLLRVPDADSWPLLVGPITNGQTTDIWWAQGRDNDEIARRPCIMNDEWTFTRDGGMNYNSNGDFFAEGGVFEPSGMCYPSTATHLTGPGGSDLTAFGDGNHSYTLDATTLTLEGLGAWIGLPKIGTDTEVNTPQQSVTLDILELNDAGPVDYLVLESKWKFANNTTGVDDAYWRITLVSYDDPSQEPPIPGPKPVAGFTTAFDGLEVTFTNTSQDATSYAWDFGDGGTSTDANPVHTYAVAGIYTVSLTATNANGTATTTQDVTVTSGSMTADLLVGGAWRVRNAANSVFVGPALGSAEWWQVPETGLNGSATGPDDWSCMTDDDFIFTAGGSGPGAGTMEYKTNGSARNDGYFGTPQGCWTDAEIAASPGAAFGSATHTYEFIPASASPSGRPIIKLTNGPTGAAFIGFYKGYYGGENTPPNPITNPWPLPNGGLSTNQYEVMSYLLVGGQEVMTVSVDLNGDADGGAAWTMVMVR
jgi:PKD repeat protein